MKYSLAQKKTHLQFLHVSVIEIRVLKHLDASPDLYVSEILLLFTHNEYLSS